MQLYKLSSKRSDRVSCFEVLIKTKVMNILGVIQKIMLNNEHFWGYMPQMAISCILGVEKLNIVKLRPPEFMHGLCKVQDS